MNLNRKLKNQRIIILHKYKLKICFKFKLIGNNVKQVIDKTQTDTEVSVLRDL